MKKAIPDFGEREIWAVETAVKERYCKAIEVMQADVELRLDPVLPVLTVCPALVWQEGGATFVISKIGDNRFRSQFFYSVREQYGPGFEEFDDLPLCVVTILKMQEDLDTQRNKIKTN
ncbi:MAG: hypothetical protein KGZ83_05640 [Sulfuricella sp.]|nr:hypothetical protein [Sulfuricella sp.]